MLEVQITDKTYRYTNKPMKNEFVFENLSYRIIGVVFDVFNALGPGLKEKTYQNAIRVAFVEKGISFKKEFYIALKFHEIQVGKRFLDFLIEEKVVLETKIGNYYSTQHIQQVKDYLKIQSLQLAILAYFGSDRVRIKRIVNLA